MSDNAFVCVSQSITNKRTFGQKDCTMGERGRYVNAQAFSYKILTHEYSVSFLDVFALTILFDWTSILHTDDPPVNITQVDIFLWGY